MKTYKSDKSILPLRILLHLNVECSTSHCGISLQLNNSSITASSQIFDFVSVRGEYVTH